MKYWNGKTFSFAAKDGDIVVSNEEFNTLICGKNKGLRLGSNSNGHPTLYHPYSDEEYIGDWRDFNIAEETEYIEMMRAQDVQMQMAEIVAELSSMDYLDMKEADGEDMTQYGDWRAARRALRLKHRELEATL